MLAEGMEGNQSLEVLSRDGGKARFNCRLSTTRSFCEREKFKFRGSFLPCVLAVTQKAAGESRTSTKWGEICVQIFTKIEQNHNCFIDYSDSSLIF